jgi:hypothetical protein
MHLWTPDLGDLASNVIVQSPDEARLVVLIDCGGATEAFPDAARPQMAAR